jgi:DNA-binding HxlR family transcriptional regulator
MYPTIPPRVDYELTELGITLLEPVMSLVNWANTNKLAISAAHRRFDEESEPERIAVQGVIYQRR